VTVVTVAVVADYGFGGLMENTSHYYGLSKLFFKTKQSKFVNVI